MDTQELKTTGYEAKSETEAFINRYLNDRAKGWPKNFLCGPDCAVKDREDSIKNVEFQKCS